MSLTFPAYFNPNFVGYDTVAVYKHFGGIFICQQVTEMLETMYNTT